MHLPLLQDFLILLGFSVVIVFILQRIKIPSILGFLLTGILIGPYGLSLITVVEEVEVISEIGVILLLFVIGMELSLKHLVSIKKTVFIGGLLQVGITVLVSAAVYFSLGYPVNEAVFVGFLFSLSSTAIVLKIFQKRNELTTPHGRNVLGILIFQDIIVVPMLLFTPIIAGESTNLSLSIVSLLLKSAVVIAVTIISIKYVVPKLMYLITKTKSKELFLLTTIAICFAVAFLTSKAGLSLALGAFLAGLIISESDYSHQATSIILPFRELFISIFFISVGMLLDTSFFVRNAGVILLIVLVVFLVKSSITSLAIAVLKYSPRTILLTGLSLFQIGEFSFILSKAGVEYNLLNEETNQYFLAVSIVSMLLTPFVIMFSESIANRALGLGLVKKINQGSLLKPDSSEEEDQKAEYENHLVIIGYGINGSNLAKAAQFSNIPYVVIELDADIVKKESRIGVPIIFGDATQEHILESAHLSAARAVVVAISDPMATKAIIGNIRAISQSIYVLVRTRYVKEINELLALGADDVIPEEFETSVEIFSHVLHSFLVPEDDIEHFIDSIRAHNYDLFQHQKKRPRTFRPTQIPDFRINCLRINKDSGQLIGEPIKDLNLRTEFGINILAISRKGKIIDNIQPEEILTQDDLLYINGKQADIERFHRMIN
jgi:CPA2 family monovalent cation:H+ antiporter-2